MNNCNKIFITGGSGFIGNYLQKYIDGETTIFDLEEPGFIHSANYIKGDVLDAEELARALNGHDIILHLAARHEDFGIRRSEYMNANEGGARAVVQAASKVGIKRLVFFSSVGVYGDGESEVTPVEFPWGNPIQLGKEVGGRRAEVGSRRSEDRGRRSGKDRS